MVRYRCLCLVLPFALFAAGLPNLGAQEAANAPAEQPIGWASVQGGTTGGRGGPVLVAKDAASFLRYIKGDKPASVHVVGTIRLTEKARVGSNKTILGLGADTNIRGGGLSVRKVHNVIIRNLAVRDAPDAIDIEASQHVWVDHCDLSRCKDGLLDVKHGSDFVTVSWNHFHDHHKTTLVGHSDKPEVRRLDTGHLRVTYHHNFFDGTQSRHPRVRYGETVHVFNNYFRNNEHGVHSAMDAGVLVEGNYFEGVLHPLDTAFGDSPEPGRLVERDNLYVRCKHKPAGRGSVKEIGDAYRYTLAKAADVPEAVRHGAGVGKVGR